MGKEYTTDQIFDMLPYGVDIYEKLDFDTYRKELQAEYEKRKEEGQTFNAMDAGIDGFKYVLKNSGKVKEEFYEIVAIAEDKTAEEIKKQSFVKTIGTIKDIFNNDEITSFFK